LFLGTPFEMLPLCSALFLLVSAAVTQIPQEKSVVADRAREARLAELRERAKARIEQERTRFSPAEVEDIEARYRSAHESSVGESMFLRWPGGAEILLDLIRTYPTSNRAGCATLELARQAKSPERERYLQQAINRYSDAWFETGVQVGALARGLLAMHYAGLDRFDEAERLAAELVRDYPGSIDDAGAPLDDVLEGLRLLRPRR
jgi:hypothetical protein